jgi:VWFA-related protein
MSIRDGLDRRDARAESSCCDTDRPVSGLTKDSFRIYEDGVEQTVSHFFGDERPISTGILLDTSASMARKLELSKQALCRFVELGVAGDQFSLYKFSDRPEQVLSFTANIKEIEDSLPHIQADGRTALFDAIYLSINNMRNSANDRKALLILSDGGDTNSRYRERESRRRGEAGTVPNGKSLPEAEKASSSASVPETQVRLEAKA